METGSIIRLGDRLASGLGIQTLRLPLNAAVSPSHGENRGSSPQRCANLFSDLADANLGRSGPSRRSFKDQLNG